VITLSPGIRSASSGRLLIVSSGFFIARGIGTADDTKVARALNNTRTPLDESIIAKTRLQLAPVLTTRPTSPSPLTTGISL
jgi:hypothetical protein